MDDIGARVGAQESPVKVELVERSSGRHHKILLTVLGFVVTGLVAYFGHRLQHQIGQSQIDVQKLEVTSNVFAAVEDPSRDPRWAIALLSSLGEEAVPSLIALLETQISRLDSPLGGFSRWPLPDYLLARSCNGDPRFSEAATIRSQPEFDREWIVWRSTMHSLRTMGNPAVEKIEELWRRTTSPSRRALLLKIFLEIKPDLQQHSSLAKLISDELKNPRANAVMRGDALSLLAFGGVPALSLPNETELDLSCRRLPKVVIRGVFLENPTSFRQGTLLLDRTEFAADTVIDNLHFSRVRFLDTALRHAIIRDSVFGGPLFESDSTPTDRTLALDDSVLERTLFVRLELPGATFTRVRFVDSVFKDCYIPEGKFDEAVFESVRFEGGAVPSAFFQQITISKLVIDGCLFGDARFAPFGRDVSPPLRNVPRAIENLGYAGIVVEKPWDPRRLFAATSFRKVPLTKEGSTRLPSWLYDICHNKSLPLLFERPKCFDN